MTTPSMSPRTWPTCCDLPMYFGPYGYSCATPDRHETDDGLFPTPVPQQRRYVGELNPNRIRNAVTVDTRGLL